MPTSTAEIVNRYKNRKVAQDMQIKRMEEVKKQYNGEARVVLPELDETELPAAVNLLAPGLDQLAMRVASVMPDVYFPPLRQGIGDSEEKARSRRLATLGWWDMNGMGMLNRRRARHLLGYGCQVVTISPIASSAFDKRDIPHWRLRNPLEAYPAPRSDEGDIEPTDCIFAYRQPLAWLKAAYPDQSARLYKGQYKDRPDTLFDLLEFNDAEETVLIVLGAAKQDGWSFPDSGATAYEELERDPNRAEIPLTVVAGRVCLDRVQGVFDQILGMYQRASKLDALETIAIHRSVFPEQWVESIPGAPGTAQIDEYADGKTGVIGVIKNGRMNTMTLQPSLQAATALDRYERNQRVTAGLPAEFGGESGSNIRTARRGEMVMGAAVDMPIQEHQEIIAASLEAENRRAIALMKACYGSKPTSFYLPRNGQPGKYPDYTPETTFETDVNFVKYSMPGTDVNGMVVSMGQRVSMGEMSIQTMMEMDPAVEDPVREMSQVQVEGVRRSLLASIEQQAAQGQLDTVTLARIISLKTLHPELHLEDCVQKAHEELQARQAAQAQSQPAGPDAQPGMTQPGQPGSPSIPPVQPSASNLAQMLQTLHQPAALAGAGPAQ